MSTKLCHLCQEPTTKHCEICDKATCSDCLNHSDTSSGEVTFCNACTAPEGNFRKTPGAKPPQRAWGPMRPQDWSVSDPRRIPTIADALDQDYLRIICQNPAEAYAVISLLRVKYEQAYNLKAEILVVDTKTGEFKNHD